MVQNCGSAFPCWWLGAANNPSYRRRISCAPALEKVMVKMADGSMPWQKIMLAILATITVVLPAPGTASSSTGPSMVCTAACCCSVKRMPNFCCR